MPGDHERRAHRDELRLGEPVTRLLGFDEGADEVVAGPPAALLAEVAEVVLDAHDRLGRAHQVLVHGCSTGPLDADHPVGELDEELAVAHGHAHQLGDDDGRQRVGEVALQVRPAALAEAGHEGLHDDRDALARGLHRAGREGLVDERTQAGVRGRVGLQHARRVVASQRLDVGGRLRRQLVEVGAEAAGVGEASWGP